MVVNKCIVSLFQIFFSFLLKSDRRHMLTVNLNRWSCRNRCYGARQERPWCARIMEYFFISIIAFTLSSIICFIFYSFIVTFPLEFRYEERPLLFLVYLKAFWLSFKRKQTSKIQHLFSENGKRLSKESRFTVIARDCR